MSETQADSIYVVHQERHGSERWVLLECSPHQLAARVIARSHSEEFACGLASALADKTGRSAYEAGVLDAGSPF